MLLQHSRTPAFLGGPLIPIWTIFLILRAEALMARFRTISGCVVRMCVVSGVLYARSDGRLEKIGARCTIFWIYKIQNTKDLEASIWTKHNEQNLTILGSVYILEGISRGPVHTHVCKLTPNLWKQWLAERVYEACMRRILPPGIGSMGSGSQTPTTHSAL